MITESLNIWGEFLFENLRSVYYLYAIAAACMVLSFLILKYVFKLNWKIISAVEVFLAALLFVTLFTSYRNGEKMIEMKDFGLKIVNCIETYKKEKNLLPAKLSELSSCLTETEIQQANLLARYNVQTKDELNKPYKEERYKEDKYSLTLHDDFLGFYYLAYREKEGKFIYTYE